MRREPAYEKLSKPERNRLENLLPDLLAAAASCTDPDATLRGCLNLVERLQRWPGYLAVLVAHPGVLRRVVGLIGASPWLGQFLLSHPELVDELLAEHYLCRLPTREALSSELQDVLDACGDDDISQMLALRNFKHSHVLHILSLDLEGLLTLDQVSVALSELADVILNAVLTRVSRRLGLGDEPPIGIIGYGKLGSREMSYASDTDIVFIYDDETEVAESKLARLARTVNQWLTEPTTAGIVYATDFRLRPYGSSGLLVTSLPAFKAYQLERAWVWEHQALTRARWIAGSGRLGTAFEAIRRQVLLKHRDSDTLRAEVLAMRERISASHTSQGDEFNVKHSRGGIIDVEFAVQHLVLRHALEWPELVGHTDNASLLAAGARRGLLPERLANAATAAFRQYRFWMHRERLRGNETVTASSEEARVHRSAVLALWDHAFEARPTNAGGEPMAA